MADEKPKMMTEEDFKKRLTAELEERRDKQVRWEIKNGVCSNPQSLAPRIEISLQGGDPQEVRLLGIKIERMLLEYAEGVLNPNAVKEQG